MAWTAAGVFDGFFEIGLGAWDVAAGALLLTEAGGTVTDWAGDDRAWLASGDILAAPAPVHRVLLDLATLTGGVGVALGKEAAGIFCNDDGHCFRKD